VNDTIGVAVTLPDLPAQDKILSLAMKHLAALAVPNADHVATRFVTLVVDSATKGDNDARLWASTSMDLLGPVVSSNARMAIARQLVAIVRRVRDPQHRVFAPGDDLPLPPPAKMRDLDGALWIHQDIAGRGCYRMSSADRRKYRSSTTGNYEGVQMWPFLLDAEGPMTEVITQKKQAN
jgi:hypothetical protein